MNERNTIRAYHQRTKHRLGAYARGPEYLDWDNQPDPYRRYDGCPLTSLPFTPDPEGQIASLDKAGISKLLELSMALSAWKVFGPDRWALRCNPSSGNLHPTETYLVCHKVDGVTDGVYHYAPQEHGLELRADLESDSPKSYCLLGLTSIAWREAWKYGERAFRYLQLDIGHALGAIAYAAATLGWQLSFLSIGDKAVANLLGLSRTDDYTDAEPEQPDLLIQIHLPGEERLSKLPDTTGWRGSANPLGGDPYLQWPIIDQAHLACIEDRPEYPSSVTPRRLSTTSTKELVRLIRQRRSAQAFIGKQSHISLALLENFLQPLMPDRCRTPWDQWTAEPRLHLILFIHRVEGLAPGLYAMPRSLGALRELQSGLSDDFEWLATDITRDDLPLFRLAEGDMRKLARTLSCHQEIASASCFSFCMLAEFDAALEKAASAYRQLHWEAGLIGQAAYLEAERIGMRGTGIGCFFDDSVHEILGIKDTQWQSLYHFTVGYPRMDNRLQTLSPYEHLGQEILHE